MTKACRGAGERYPQPCWCPLGHPEPAVIALPVKDAPFPTVMPAIPETELLITRLVPDGTSSVSPDATPRQHITVHLEVPVSHERPGPEPQLESTAMVAAWTIGTAPRATTNERSAVINTITTGLSRKDRPQESFTF